MRLVWIIRNRKYVFTGILLVLTLFAVMYLGTHLSSPSDTETDTSENVVVYDDFIEQRHKYRRKLSLKDSKYSSASKLSKSSVRVENSESVEKGVRVLKTMLGAIVLKELSFTPKYPSLWKGYSEKKDALLQQLAPQQSRNGSNEAKPGVRSIKSLFRNRKSKTKRTPQQNAVAEKRSDQYSLDPKDRVRDGMLKIMALRSRLHSGVNESSQKVYNPGINNNTLGRYCSTPLCLEFLTNLDMPHFKYCQRKANLSLSSEPKLSTCVFMIGSGRHPVALAGYPSSGQTVLRKLLQRVTGICTGATNCDTTLRQNGFPGEYIRSGVVLVTKTHQNDPRWTGVLYKSSVLSKGFKREQDNPVFGSAVYLVRNPVDAVQEEWSGTDLKEEEWNDFVFREMLEWEENVLAWVINNMDHPVLVVKYEDLKENTVEELKKIVEFIQAPYSNSELSQSSQYFEREINRRTVILSQDQKDHINSIVGRTISSLEEAGLSEKCNLSSYGA